MPGSLRSNRWFWLPVATTLLACCFADAEPSKVAIYVLDVDTNIKGEFGSVAPELTEALQLAFAERHNAFTILERRHLDQLVRANQLERDMQAISRGEHPSEQFVRQVHADGFLRAELVDGADGAVLTVTLVSLNSVVMWQGQARESRAGWLVHENQHRNAEKLAAEADVYLRPTPPGRAAASQLPASSNAQPLGQTPSSNPVPEVKPGTFVTASYSLSAGTTRKDGERISLSLTLESLSDKPFRFVTLSVSCYLLDEDGNRWNQDTADSAGFAWSGVQIDPGMKVKSNFSFVAKDATTGTKYSLICPEASPQQGRRITIQGITSR
jgi:hypothetical protein